MICGHLWMSIVQEVKKKGSSRVETLCLNPSVTNTAAIISKQQTLARKQQLC